MADDPNLYGYCGQNPVNNIDPTGHFSVGIQKGYGLFSASVNAVGLLTKNYDLCTAMSTLSLFVAVHGSWDRIVDTVKGLFGGNKYTRYGNDIKTRIQGYIEFEGEIREALNDPDVLRDVIESINDRGLAIKGIQEAQKSNNVTKSKNKEDEDADKKNKRSATAEAKEAFNRWLDSKPELRFGMKDGIMFPEEFYHQLLFEAVYHNVDLSKLSILDLDQMYMIEFSYMYPKYLRFETAAMMLAVDPKSSNSVLRTRSLRSIGLMRGSLVIEPGEYSSSEIGAARSLYEKGYNVTLRQPVGTRAGGGTSDLLVNGLRYDVYTPITNNPNRIISAIASKNTQAVGIVLDLSQTNVSVKQLGNILLRVRNAGATNINDVIIFP